MQPRELPEGFQPLINSANVEISVAKCIPSYDLGSMPFDRSETAGEVSNVRFSRENKEKSIFLSWKTVHNCSERNFYRMKSVPNVCERNFFRGKTVRKVRNDFHIVRKSFTTVVNRFKTFSRCRFPGKWRVYTVENSFRTVMNDFRTI